mgnify:FL=1
MNIEIYSKPDCPYCDRAVHIAQQIIQETTHIKYEKKMLDEDFTFEELLEKSPNARTFPQIFVDGELVGGYTEFEKVEWWADRQ